MPDVGVLNLQIRDDSAQAADGLDKLVGLLERMKGATSGIKLTPIATGINKIKEAISKIGQGEIDQLSQLADILNRIQGAAQGVNGIKISFGKAKQEADRIRESMEAARGGTGNGAGNGTELAGNFVNISAGIQSARNEFAALYGEVEKFNGLVENTAWQFGDMGKRIAQVIALWNQMRMAMSLPTGGNGRLLSGAITGEGSISDPNEIVPYASSLEQVRDGAVHVQEAAAEMEQVRDGAVQAQEAAAEMAQSVHAASTETETLGESARGTKEQLEYEAEFLRRCAEMADKYKASEEANKEVNARFGRMMQPLSLEETDNMASYVTELTKMEAELEKASAAYNKFVNTLGAGDVKSINAALKLNKIREAIDKYREAQERASTPRRSVGDTNAAAAQVTQYDQLIAKLHEAREAYNALMNDPSATASQQAGGAMAIHKAEADINAYNALQEKLQTVRPEVQQFAQEQLNAGVSAKTLQSKLFDLDGELKQKKKDMGDVAEETKTVGQRFKELMLGSGDLKGAMSRMFPTLSGMLKRFSQLAKYRMLRAVITQISKGFREGMENYYHYSEAIGGSFAPAMDSAATSLQQLKNSIGAAVAPAIQALIPILNTVVNWVITAVNYLNQFFALLRGQATWSKAMPVATKAFDDQSKKAKKASAAVKDLLADWDELNIIQSNTSGSTGGTGSKTSADYKTMFEEVQEFDENIKKLVDGIKAEFGSIQNLVTAIGAGLAGWKIASEFAGIVGLLAGIVAAGAIIYIEFHLVSMFDKNFLETGDEGWLIADVLTTFLGGILMKKVLDTALGGEWSTLGIPIALTVSALAGFVSEIGETDMSALDPEALELRALDAAKAGAAASYLLYATGHHIGKSLIAGGAVALLTFGVMTEIKAGVRAVQNGAVTEETIKSAALGSLALSAGFATVAKLAGATMLQSLGFGALAGTAVTLITLGATVGIVASIKAQDSGITEEVLAEDIKSSLMTGVGSMIAIKMITHQSWIASAAQGAGVACVVMSALIGIQATTQAVKNEEITDEVVKNDAIASLLMAGGIVLLGGSLVAAGGLALVTFGALIGIQALLTQDKEVPVRWGDYNATQQEIQDYVLAHGFAADVPATISLINSTVSILPAERQKLVDDINRLDIGMNAVRLGANKEESYEQLRTDLETTISDIQGYAESQKTLIKTSFSLVPMVDSSGSTDNAATSEAMKAGLTGWQEVQDYMGKIGGQLAEALKGETKNGLKTFDDELIQTLMEKFSNVQKAITQAQLSSQGLGSLSKGLTDLSHGSFSGAIDVWDDYKKELEEKYREMLTEELTSYRSLEAFYRARGEEGDEQRAEYYKNLADGLQDAFEGRLKAALDEITEPGRQMFRDAILKMLNVKITKDDITGGLGIAQFVNMRDFFESLFESGVSEEDAKESFNDWMDLFLAETFGEDYDVLQKLIESGALTYGDLIPKEELLAGIGDLFEDGSEIKNKLIQFVDTMFPEKSEIPTEKAEELVEEAAEGIEDAAQDMPETELPFGVKPEPYIEPGDEQIDIDTGSGTGAGIGLPIDLQFDADKSWIGNIAEQLGFELVNGQYVLKAYIKYITDDQAGNKPNLDEETRSPIPGGAQLWTVEKSGVTPGAEWAPGGAQGGTMNVVAEVDNSEQESNVANGVTRGMTGVENLLDSIARTVVGILNKPVPTAGSPTANEGRRNAQAAREYGLVTGYNS